MIRVASRNLNPKKKARFALSVIRGIGKSNVKKLLQEVFDLAKESESIDLKMSWEDFYNAKLGDYSEEVVVLFRNTIESNYLVEEDLRRFVMSNVKRLTDLGTWRGHRHKVKLPIHGRTRKNARTNRGNSRSSGVANKIKTIKK